jgi:hypothetical protein
MEILSVEKKVELEKRLEESKHKAEELIKDKEKTEDTIDEAIKKANKIEEEGVLKMKLIVKKRSLYEGIG